MKNPKDTAIDIAKAVNLARTELKDFTQEELVKYLRNLEKPCPYGNSVPSVLVKRGYISNTGLLPGRYSFTISSSPIHYNIFCDMIEHSRQNSKKKLGGIILPTSIKDYSAMIKLADFTDTSLYSKSEMEELEKRINQSIGILKQFGFKVLKPEPRKYSEIV